MLFLAQIFIFLSVVLIFYSLRNLMIAHTEASRRLQEKSGRHGAPQLLNPGLALDDSVLKSYEKYLTPADPEKLTRLRELLIRAGYRQPYHVRIYNAVRFLTSAIGIALGVLVFPFILSGANPLILVTVMFLSVMMGFFAPRFWLERTHQYRSISAREGFPDAMDLILVCLEAGHGFDQALNRVVGEIRTSNAILAEEFEIVVRELRVGKDRYRVLGDFAWRTGVEDIASFITVVKQADKFGVSIADALRVYSAEMRDKRYRKAEERANMMPVKLALGAIAFTVPPAILVMVGPSLLMIARHLAGIGS